MHRSALKEQPLDSEGDRATPETDRTKRPSELLVDNSIHAATASIEIFNKPNFAYRHEIFAMLISNAWELLLKAKTISDNGENTEAVYHKDKHGGREKVRTNRSGNPMTLGLRFLVNTIATMKGSEMQPMTRDNILELSEYRNDAVHLSFSGSEVKARIARLGAASLRNYALFVKTWFGRDLVPEDYPILPMTFLVPHALAGTAGGEEHSHVRRILDHWDALDREHQGEDARQAFSVTLELRHRKTRDPDGMSYRLSNDPDAPALQLQEADMSDAYPWTSLSANICETSATVETTDQGGGGARCTQERTG